MPQSRSKALSPRASFRHLTSARGEPPEGRRSASHRDGACQPNGPNEPEQPQLNLRRLGGHAGRMSAFRAEVHPSQRPYLGVNGRWRKVAIRSSRRERRRMPRPLRSPDTSGSVDDCEPCHHDCKYGAVRGNPSSARTTYGAGLASATNADGYSHQSAPHES